MRTEILQATEEYLAEHAPTAAKSIVEVITSKVPVLGAQNKLAASNSLLDRVGLGKRETLEVNLSTEVQGIFILPAKKENT
jgi:hypothetical protein